MNLFTLVVDRFTALEGQLSSISPDDSSEEELENTAQSAALVLANASQLLHFVSKDGSLIEVFKVGLFLIFWYSAIKSVIQLSTTKSG